MNQERMQLIREMLDQNPADPFLNYAAALEYRKAGKFSDAIALFEKLLQEHPEYLPTYYQLGQTLESRDRVDEAIVVYKQGRKVAHEQQDIKTLGEIEEALMILGAEE